MLIVNSSSSALSIGTGIGTIATGATFVGIPVSAALGSISLAGAISTGISSALLKDIRRSFLEMKNYMTWLHLPLLYLKQLFQKV